MVLSRASSHPARGAWIEIRSGVRRPGHCGSHPARGAWIEMTVWTAKTTKTLCRTPQGVRGLKYAVDEHTPPQVRRTPQGVRGLKYSPLFPLGEIVARRTPQGVRGLKSAGLDSVAPLLCRTPQGVRGLKLRSGGLRHHGLLSHPARGAWIEIRCPVRSARTGGSHPARGAWIEISMISGAAASS